MPAADPPDDHGRSVALLRHFRVTVGGRQLVPGSACERLIAYLALEDRTQTREHIAGTLWPDSTQARAAGNLRRVLSLIHPQSPGLIRRETHRLSLAADVSVDVRRQRALMDEITNGERSGVDSDDLQLLRGDLLPDWDEPWLTPVREELRQLRVLSLEAVAVAQLADERPASALALALCAAREDPLRESAHRLVVQAHLAQGNGASAARHYDNYRSLLWSELRLRPGLHMQALVKPLLREAALAV